jgi:hypothetical protein
MTLHDQFEQQLAGLPQGPGRVAVSDGPRHLTCEITEHNALAVSLLQVQLRTSELAQASLDHLNRISTVLSERLTYLMEPISPIEIDADACVVQMRSSPPQRDDDGRTYYELLVRRGGEISLCRYRKEKAAGRQQVSATLTREVLTRLVSDFCAVLA